MKLCVGFAAVAAVTAMVGAALAAEGDQFLIRGDATKATLVQNTLNIATAEKSNSTILAIDAALEDVKSGRTLPVPEHLRDAHYPGAKRLGHGVGYQYAHDFPGHFVPQDYLGADKQFYEPTDQGHEKEIKARVAKWRALRKKVSQ